jgi:hypothetical protein
MKEFKVGDAVIRTDVDLKPPGKGIQAGTTGQVVLIENGNPWDFIVQWKSCSLPCGYKYEQRMVAHAADLQPTTAFYIPTPPPEPDPEPAELTPIPVVRVRDCYYCEGRPAVSRAKGEPAMCEQCRYRGKRK